MKLQRPAPILTELIWHLDHEGAFDEEKWGFKIYKESCIDEWHVASHRCVYGTGETLEEACLQALLFVVKQPNYYKTKAFKKIKSNN